MAEVRRILVVDDNFRILDSVKSMLEIAGKDFQVIGVPSAEEGLLEMLREPVDLLITDIYLPGISGDELIKRANALWPELPIIVITGHAEKMDEEEARRSGIVQYFKKPMDPDALVETVCLVLDSVEDQDGRLSDEPSQAPAPVSSQPAVNAAGKLELLMEQLRHTTGAREVMLAKAGGEILYATGGKNSAFQNLVGSYADTVSGILDLAAKLGGDDPFIYNFVADSQMETHFATAGSDYIVAVLYYAQVRKASIDSVWSEAKGVLESIRKLGCDYSIDALKFEPTDQPPLVEPDASAKITPSQEKDSLDTEPEDKTEQTLGSVDLELPEFDETVDLEAFWDDALAAEVGSKPTGEVLDYDEALEEGLLPPEFDPSEQTS